MANSSTADVTRSITEPLTRALHNLIADKLPSDAVTQIGGIAIGAAGTGIYSGYTLSAGDDFTSLDLVSAANPTGKYFTTRTYSSNGGARAPNSGGLAIEYDVSPDHTGWQDSNRGVPVASFATSHQIVPGEGTGALRLLAIRQTAAEQLLLNTGVSGQIERTAMISGVGAFWGQPPYVIEFRAAMPVGPHGQHPDLWGLTANPPGGPAFTGDEYGWECGNSKVAAYHNDWAGGVLTGSETDINNYRDGNYHTFTAVVSTTDWKFYVDTTSQKTYNTTTPYTRGHSAHAPLITHHILNSLYQSQTYISSEWDPANLPNGIYIDIEWIRIWRANTGTHYVPLTTLPDVQATAGGALNVVLPSQATLWGGAVTEYVTCVQNEVEEPGASNTTTYAQFPAGISYNSGTRTLSGTMPSQSGAMYVVVGVQGDGNTCIPARFRVTVAPVYIGPAQFNWSKGVAVSQDIYVAWDCGRLFQANSNPKGLIVSGLPAGLSFSAATGLITGTPTASNTGTISLSATNSAGQTTSANITYLTIDPALGAAAPSLSGSPTLLASWDFDQTASVGSTSGNIDSIMGVDGTTFTLTGTGTTRPTTTTRNPGSGNRGAASFSSATSSVLQAASNLGLTSNGATMVIIAEPKTTSQAGTYLGIEQSSATATVNRLEIGTGTGTTGWSFRKCGATGGNFDANQGVAYTATPTLVIGRSGASGTTAGELNVNGVGTGIFSGGSTSNPTSTNLTVVGCRSVSSVLGNFANFYLYRVLIYSGSLTDAQVEAIAVWANTNYGTTNSP